MVIDHSGFRVFGPDHLIALLLTGLACLFVLRAVPAWTEPRRRVLGIVLAVALAGYGAATYVRAGMAGALSWEYSLPLHVCDLMAVACIFALVRPHPLAFEITYFVGFAGALAASITPDLRDAFPSWGFVHFFWGHSVLLVAIAFLIATGQRPRPRSVLRMMAAINIYVVLVGMLDLVTGWNYGYLRRPPAGATLVDHMGPWPWYLLAAEAIALVGFFLLALPWRAKDEGGRMKDEA